MRKRGVYTVFCIDLCVSSESDTTDGAKRIRRIYLYADAVPSTRLVGLLRVGVGCGCCRRISAVTDVLSTPDSQTECSGEKKARGLCHGGDSLAGDVIERVCQSTPSRRVWCGTIAKNRKTRGMEVDLGRNMACVFLNNRVCEPQFVSLDELRVHRGVPIVYGTYRFARETSKVLGVKVFVAPWKLSYADGNGNQYRFVRASADVPVSVLYRPVKPKVSSSGSYSGGAPYMGPMAEGAASELTLRVERLALDSQKHIVNRVMFSGDFRIESGEDVRNFIIGPGDCLSEFDAFLVESRS